MEADLAQIEKKGMPTGMFATHPISGEKLPVWVGNYVLMGYGEGAVMGVPAHDERDYAFALKYKLPIKPVIRHPRGRQGRSAVEARVRRIRRLHQLRKVRRARRTRLPSTRSPPTWRRRAWVRSRSSGGCATGASRASATGARRSRSCTAPACGDVPVPDEQLPVLLPEDVVPDGTGNPLNKLPRPTSTRSARRAASRPSARPTRWTRSSTRRGTSRASPARTRTRRWSTSARTTGWRSTSTSAASSTPSCTCSTRASSRARCATRACCQAWPSRSPTC